MGQKNLPNPPCARGGLRGSPRFSLSHAPFLVHLATRVNSRDPSHRGCRLDDLYHCYKRPKKAGGKRLITAPTPLLKTLQRKLLDHGFSKISISGCATGFRQRTSIGENAIPPVGKPWW